MTILNEEIQNVLLAALLGAVLGFEREWRGKDAGLRTLMLVSVGSALFTIVSYQMAILDIKHNSDVTRIASNIVTGVGFLGAGLIFRGNQSNVQGLTTAATVWASAAIGMAAGIGNYFLAIETTAVTLGILVVLHRFEVWFEAMKETREYHIAYTCGPAEGLLNYDDFFGEKGFKLLKAKQEITDGKMSVTWRVRGSRDHHDVVTARLVRHERIVSLEY